MRKTIYLLSLLFCFHLAQSQVLYFCESNNGIGNNHFSKLGTIDVSTCEINTLFDTIRPPISDIAFAPNGDFYASGRDTNVIYRVDLTTGDLETAIVGIDAWSIVISNENILYGTKFNHLYKYDLNTNANVIELDTIPAPESSSSIGLAFAGCKLVTSNPIFPFFNQITEVNWLAPENSYVLGEPVMTNSFFSYQSMTSYQNDCTDTTRLFVIAHQGFLFSIGEYFFQNNEYVNYCDFESGFINLAHPNEPLLPSYRPSILLDPDNSSGLPTPDYQSPADCNNTFPIADTDMTIDICHGVDSVRVWIAEGQVDGTSEIISAAANANIIVQGDQSSALLLINDGAAENTDFTTLVANSLYSNNAVTPTPGLRKIAFVGYCGYFAGDTAYAYINVQAPAMAGEDNQLSFCTDDLPTDLFDLLSDEAQTNGNWQPNTISGNGIFDPLQDTPGIYYYIVGEVNCPMDTAEILVELLSNPVFTFPDSISLCEGENNTITAPIVAASYEWQDGSISPSYTINSPGLYWLELLNSDGCSWRDSFVVNTATAFTATTEANICEDDNYLFENILLENDTSFCITYSSFEGCDSTLCIELSTNSTLFSEVMVEICSGESYLFGNEQLSQSGIYENMLLSTQGCDSVVLLQLDVLTSPNTGIQNHYQLPAEGSLTLSAASTFAEYLWSNGDTGATTNILTAGEYSLTVVDDFNCVTIVIFEVEPSERYYLPNAFSPNGDGFNDYFTLYPGDAVAEVSLFRVYNRWGEKVFEAAPLSLDREQSGWDGFFRGEAVPSGIYLYWLEIEFVDGNKEQVTGDLLLIR